MNLTKAPHAVFATRGKTPCSSYFTNYFAIPFDFDISGIDSSGKERCGTLDQLCDRLLRLRGSILILLGIQTDVLLRVHNSSSFRQSIICWTVPSNKLLSGALHIVLSIPSVYGFKRLGHYQIPALSHCRYFVAEQEDRAVFFFSPLTSLLPSWCIHPCVKEMSLCHQLCEVWVDNFEWCPQVFL